MKKTIVFLIVLISSAYCFGQGLSLGVGIGWDPYWNTTKQTLGDAWSKSEFTSPVSFDGQIYLDEKYILGSIGFLATGTYFLYTETDGSGYKNAIVKSNGDVGGWLIYSIILKWPIHAGKGYIFPLIGAEFDQNIIYTDAGKNDLRGGMSSDAIANLDSFWGKFGFGSDFRLSSATYLRLILIGNLKLLNKDDRDYISWLSNLNSDTVTLTYFRLSTGLSIGFHI